MSFDAQQQVATSGVVVHPWNPNIWEAEAEILL